ncbi:MAG: DUF3971 domain-containing protein, partial [Candidatus Thorarchaeota archaeon]
MDELDKFWPLFLNQKGVRDWVIKHISDGILEKAYAHMFLRHNKSENKTYLKNIDSKVYFLGSLLNYDNDFPPISNIKGVANFSEKEVNINIEKGEVLGNRISNASISTPDLKKKPYVLLTINGNLLGKFSGIIGHLNYDSSNVNKGIGQYLDGIADTKLYISLPIKNNLFLKDLKINLLSNVSKANTKYIKNDSEFLFLIDKKANDSNIVIDTDFNDAEINLPSIGLNKTKNKPGNVKINLLAEPNKNIGIKNLEIIGEDIYLKAFGELSSDGERIISLNTENIKFGKNNFNIFYNSEKVTDNNISRINKINIIGDTVDLRPFLNFGDFSKFNDNDNEKVLLKFLINLDRIILENEEKISNFKAEVERSNNAFVYANVSGNIKPDKSLSLIIEDQPKQNFKNNKNVKIAIDDIGSLIKGFNWYDKMLGGNGWIGGDAYMLNGRQVIEGKIIIEDKFGIIKTKSISEKFLDKLPDIDLIKDERMKLYKENIIVFQGLKSHFVLRDNTLEINDMRFHGVNFGLGITVNGKIYLATSETHLEGLIVPVYRLNSLPIIKDIPVVGKILVGEEGGGLFALKYDY